MARKVTYWISTGLVAALAAFAGFNYLSGSPQSVQGFAHLGYPPHLRILLGIAKILGAITLVVPGFVKLKEWAYAGFTFAWIAAFVAHYNCQGVKPIRAAGSPGIAVHFLFHAPSEPPVAA